MIPTMIVASSAYTPESVTWNGTTVVPQVGEVKRRVSDELRAMGEEALREYEAGETEEWPLSEPTAAEPPQEFLNETRECVLCGLLVDAYSGGMHVCDGPIVEDEWEVLNVLP